MKLEAWITEPEDGSYFLTIVAGAINDDVDLEAFCASKGYAPYRGDVLHFDFASDGVHASAPLRKL